MTNYKDILTKFQIEYDKEGGTFSSYPSLTEYEIATILDKAYLALIAQKLTGNNPRRAVFEADTKAIEDLRGLINTEKLNKDSNIDDPVNNEKCFTLPDDMLYFIQGAAKIGNYTHTVALISHDTAKNFSRQSQTIHGFRTQQHSSKETGLRYYMIILITKMMIQSYMRHI